MLTTIRNTIDNLNEWVGRFTAWLVLAMVLVICYDVAMRYFFQQGSVALQEVQWHFFALIFLLGSAYTLKHDCHVRVDLFYNSKRLTEKHRALINIIGIILFLFPFCGLILFSSWTFVETAFYYNEGSPDPGGLPHRYLIKASILVGFSLLVLQGIAELIRHITTLREVK